MPNTTRRYSIYCDLKQLEKNLDWPPSDVIDAILSLGDIVDCKLNIGRQEIIDGVVITHPVLDCIFDSTYGMEPISEILLPEYFVVDLIEVKAPSDQINKSILEKLELLIDEFFLTRNYLNDNLFESTKKTKAMKAQIEHITSRLNRLIKSEKFCPFRKITFDLQKFILDNSQSKDKKVLIQIEGGEIKLEVKVLEQLLPAIKEVVSNLLQFSIETTTQRNFQKVPESAEITILASKHNDLVEVAFSDDGKGLSRHKLKDLVTSLKELCKTNDIIIQPCSTPPSVKLRCYNSAQYISCFRTEINRMQFAIPQSHLISIQELNYEEFQQHFEISNQRSYYKYQETLLPCLLLEDVINYNSQFCHSDFHQWNSEESFARQSWTALHCQLGSREIVIVCNSGTVDSIRWSRQTPCSLEIFIGRGFDSKGTPTYILDTFIVGEAIFANNQQNLNNPSVRPVA